MELMPMSWKFEAGSWKLEKKGFAPGEVDTSTESKGFTLIELLVVISIIAILAVVGVVVFTGIQKSARDAKRRGDIEAIAKAYEVKYQAAGGKYQSLADSDFASGGIPVPPEGGDYFRVTDSEGSGFKVCAALESNSADVCNTPSPNCFCKISSQGVILQGSTLSGTHTDLGLGGSSYSACDTNGTLAIGLAGYWKMDEGTNNIVVDSSGHGNNGTLTNGPTWTGGKLGPAALSFDGSDDYIEVSYSTSLSTANGLTVTGWVNIVGNGQQGYNGLILHAGGYDTDNRILIGNDGNVLSQFSIGASYPAGYSSLSTANGLVPTGTWTLITYTYDGAVETIYVNNQSKATNPKTGGIYGGTSPLRVGWGNSADVYTMNGLIDDVRIYNRALSQDEITALANGCMSP